MKAALRVVPKMPHQAAMMQAFESGLKRHRIAAEYILPGQQSRADFTVVWGQKNATHVGARHLILDAGYINGTQGDYVNKRLRFVSMNWNGAHGLGLAPPRCNGDRWQALGIEPRRWKRKARTALLLGQHPGDVASGVNHKAWLGGMTTALAEQYAEIVVREHPLINPTQPPLDEALRHADVAYTYASTAAVEAVLAGVPTWTFSESSIAYPVTCHALGARPVRPDRAEWCRDLAYRQWTLEEIVSGAAWDWMQWGARYDETRAAVLQSINPERDPTDATDSDHTASD